MQKYKCHKVVEAARIESIGPWSPDTETSPGLAFMKLEGDDGVTIDSRFFAKHTPQVGDYFVRYDDNYISVSPAKAFVEGYTPLDVKDSSLLDEAGLEKALNASPAPRVTKEAMQARIASTVFTRVTDTLTQCRITLDNGFTVTGESACVNAANYRQDIGETVSFNQAFGKLWPLFGFMLAESNKNGSK